MFHPFLRTAPFLRKETPICGPYPFKMTQVMPIYFYLYIFARFVLITCSFVAIIFLFLCNVTCSNAFKLVYCSYHQNHSTIKWFLLQTSKKCPIFMDFFYHVTNYDRVVKRPPRGSVFSCFLEKFPMSP